MEKPSERRWNTAYPSASLNLPQCQLLALHALLYLSPNIISSKKQIFKNYFTSW